MRNLIVLSFLVLLLSFFGFPVSAQAQNVGRDLGNIESGVGKGLNGAFALPTRIIQGAARSFPFGIVTGAIQGTFETVGWVVSGAVDAAKGAAPYAKYLVFM